MEAHLKSMEELTDKLAAINAPISEEDQVVTLLGSLPRKYSTLVTTLEARVDDVSLSYVQQALILRRRRVNTANHKRIKKDVRHDKYVRHNKQPLLENKE